MKKKSLLLLLLMTALFSCSKYEEGPALSLRSKTQRVCGTWTLAVLLENGVEKNDDYNTRWEFNASGSTSRTITDPVSGIETVSTGTWSFNDDKTKILVVISIPSLQLTLNEEWTILRLKEKELWIETTQYGNLYEYQLQQ
jgi:hypothetical protein